jgi:diguanylate cyclase (GGDEF)-like protein
MRATPAAEWEPALVENLYDLLDRVDSASPALLDGIAKLESRYHDAVYSELLYLLSHLRFEPQEARGHWDRILEHRESTRGPGGEPVDVRVALVSYFVEVNRKLHNPKIIEMKLFERTRDGAYRDDLTGLHNYRMFRECLDQEVQQTDRSSSPLSLVMLDIDDFKRYNDTHGHEAGNAVLSELARVLATVLRKSDLAARYGGEEFVLLLPATTKTAARAVAERARQAVRKRLLVTVSLGVSTYPADATNASELVRHADRAMYVAKTAGKDQVQLYGESRRSFERIGAALHGKLRLLGADALPVTTVDISEGGLRFEASRALEPGALVEFQLRVPSAEKPIGGVGRVVHSEPVATGKQHVAVRILEIVDGGKVVLRDYVRARSRRRS